MKKWPKVHATEGTEYANVVVIDIDCIKLPEGHGPLDQAEVERLANCSWRTGLLHPLIVRETEQGYVVVFGWHLFAACKVTGLTTVPCLILEGDKLRLQLAKIEEKLRRRELSPLERTRLVRRRDEILENWNGKRFQ